jgi:hypothetical protein
MVAITNGHNTSQGTALPESFARRIWRWVRGPNIDPVADRLRALALGPRKKGLMRRFLWWLRSSSLFYRHPEFNENLALGWFTSDSPHDPLTDGSGLIVHAALGDNGELWARVGDRCLPAIRGLQNIRICYAVALRERGAVYYAAAAEGASGIGTLPKWRPIAIDAFQSDQTLYAGVHQCALGQIGFRVDTRVHHVYVDRLPEMAAPFGTAHAADSLIGDDELVEAIIGGAWETFGALRRTPQGVHADSVEMSAILRPPAPSGLIHALLRTDGSGGSAGLVWRFHDPGNYWIVRISPTGATLSVVRDAIETLIASNRAIRVTPGVDHSLQIFDGPERIGCFLDGQHLFDHAVSREDLVVPTGVGFRLEARGAWAVCDFEAHPRSVELSGQSVCDYPLPSLGKVAELEDDFIGPAGDLAGRRPSWGVARWERTLGRGVFEVTGTGDVRVRATVESPNPGRTFYTLPWRCSAFADLSVSITPPGTDRGQNEQCRAGLVFWQGESDYLSFSVYLDDSYHGASIALFTKRHGFEELYDAIWTMVADKIFWGREFGLRVVMDGDRFDVLLNGEIVMQRALSDIYPDDSPLQIHRVGLVTNWEWGDDTGSIFRDFAARRRHEI